MDDDQQGPGLTGVDRALLAYLDDVNDYAGRLREEASRALTRAVRQAADFGWSQRRIAAAVGRSQPEVARLLRLSRTPAVEYAVVEPEAQPPDTPPADGATARDPGPPAAERPPSTLTWVLRDKREEIVRIAERNGAHNVRVFGSVARGEDDAESDIDFLFDYGPQVGLFEVAGLKVELEAALGRPVDVADAGSLWPRIARKALAEAVPL